MPNILSLKTQNIGRIPDHHAYFISGIGRVPFDTLLYMAIVSCIRTCTRLNATVLAVVPRVMCPFLAPRPSSCSYVVVEWMPYLASI